MVCPTDASDLGEPAVDEQFGTRDVAGLRSLGFGRGRRYGALNRYLLI
jgi:hypothetical protein